MPALSKALFALWPRLIACTKSEGQAKMAFEIPIYLVNGSRRPGATSCTSLALSEKRLGWCITGILCLVVSRISQPVVS